LKTIAITHKISIQNETESAACGYRPKTGINIARRGVKGNGITAAPAKNVTYLFV
jgi:hypothetical protein